MPDKKPPREAVEKLNQTAKHFYHTFTSPSGKKVLEFLERELNSDKLIASTPHETSYNVGRRDAFIYIQQMMRYAENAGRE
jgi:hypothetical protein